ncbi:synaptopodin-2 [Denticeps clupeoides]|uniref:synaptopodin-2 n=1 Tax=Denticeps clupeoides TaxID=299321 RepID=UPI0010A3B955|nr:synaptopodin [Denticeps clupeoides]XP_028815405.1 synaptopodin [Denticeps clupeoides]
MEGGQEAVRRMASWTGPGATATGSLGRTARGRPETEANSTLIWQKGEHNRVKGKPNMTSSTNQPGQKTNLSRSASLSEKELKEARTRSQIIAAQLTVPSSSSSRGVQLFNRRKQRVNAFTLVSYGGGGRDESRSESDLPPRSALTWENKLSRDLGGREGISKSSETRPPWSPREIKCIKGDIMEGQGEPVHGAEDDDTITRERHFLPVNEMEGELPGEPVDEVKDEVAIEDGSATYAQLSRGREETEPNGTRRSSVDAPGDVPNGCHDTEASGKASSSLAKQAAAITNRTARPFFSPATVRSSEVASPAPDIPSAPSYSTPPLPAIQKATGKVLLNPAESPAQDFMDSPLSEPPRPFFSPPPPAPSYPTPPLPFFSSPTLTGPSRGPPTPHYIAPTVARPIYTPQLMCEKRPQTPIRTGILDEGVVRRGNRKSMFTFQEKPRLEPNPELLSLVQGTDEKKKMKSQPDHTPEEELLALGAEASNFLAKGDGVVEEDLYPEWSSCLKSSRTRAKMEHKPEQALTNASGKGAELFAKRQSRMEKYVLDKSAAGQIRSPSPTMSLPPSWVYPSTMPGRVKAIVNASNVSTEISKTLKAQQSASKKSIPQRALAPPPPPESPALENGCSKIEMELARHQPYQISSSLFILNPTKDPMSPPKSMATVQTFSRQTSLPTSPPSYSNPPGGYRPAQCFSPPLSPSPRGVTSPMSALSPERVASPRSGVQVPRPTFSARKAGIEPQRSESPATPAASRTPNLTRRFSSPEGPSSVVWSPSASHANAPSPRPVHRPMAASPVSPVWDSRCQSPVINHDTKANHRLLAKNIINAAKRKNSPSPGALSGHGLATSPGQKPTSPFQPRSPMFTSPPPTPTIRSPVRLYNTRSLTDSDASVESEDSGWRSPGLRSYNTCPRGWSSSLRVKRGPVPADL